MKHLLLSVLILFLSLSAISQTVVYTEDFEGSTYQLTNTGTGTSSWDINTRLQNGGLKCDSATLITANDNPILQTSSFSTIGSTSVKLKFSHICNLDLYDGGIVELSIDNGITWAQLTKTHYTGNGILTIGSNKFNNNSYPNIWNTGSPNYSPDNSWWQTESFDISVFAANQTNVQIRFVINDGQNNGSNGYNGWFLDDIEVTMANSELNPPVINNLNNYSGIVFSCGPFNINAEITDQSGVDTAIVYYTVNGGPQQSVGMTITNGDTLKGIIPTVTNNDTICYYIYASDNAQITNSTTEPINSCFQFISNTGIVLPYYDNFDQAYSYWTHINGSSSNTTIWERGTSHQFTTPYSSPNVWCTNLDDYYDNYANAYLVSPVFDFSQAKGAILKFKHFYKTVLSRDGARLEYTLDGATWQILGSFNDSLATNWYTRVGIYSSNSKPAWAGETSEWINSTYKLDFLDSVNTPIQFRFVFTSNGISQYDGFYIDNFVISTTKKYDLELLGFSQPFNDTTFSSPQIIEVKITNVGSKTITFANTPLTINANVSGSYPSNLIPVIINTDSISPGDTITVMLSNNYDMSLNGFYSFNASISCSLDTANYNNVFNNYEINNYTIQSIPFFEDFEAFSYGDITKYQGWLTDYSSHTLNYYTTWTIRTGEYWYFDWTPNFDNTTKTPRGNYVFSKFSNASTGDSTLLLTPYIDIPIVSEPIQLSFYYHMHGEDMGDLSVDILHNGMWIKDQIVISGQQQQTADDSWKKALLNLDSYKGNTIRLRFKAIRINTSYGIAIDDIEIYKMSNIDMEVIGLDKQPISECFSNAELINVLLRNNGIDTINFANNNTSINCENVGVNPYIFPSINLYSGTLAPGDTMSVTISNNFNMSFNGQYIFNIQQSTIGDNISNNDTIINDNVTNIIINTFPYFEDFESISTSSLYSDIPPVEWESSDNSNSLYYWLAENDCTPSYNSGPCFDHTLGTSSGIYFYTKAINSSNDTTCLTSKCIDLRNYSNPKFKFWYHMYGQNIGSLNIDIFHNGNWIDNVISLTGAQQSSANDPWKDTIIDLSSYANSIINIRFRAYKSSTNNSDIAIDDIEIYQEIAQDIGVVKILEPLDVNYVGTYSDIKVIIKNYGYDTVSSFNLITTLNSNNQITQSFNNIIAPNESDTLNINGYNYLLKHNTVSVETSLVGDINTSNDKKQKTYQGVPTGILYYNNFDSQNIAFSVDSSSYWEWGTPAGDVINNAFSGSKAWMIDLDNYYTYHLNEILEFPQTFDFSQVEGAVLNLAHWDQTTMDSDGGLIEYSTNLGASWDVLGDEDDPLGFNWYNSYKGWSDTIDNWVLSAYDLSMFDYSNQVVKFRIVFDSDGSLTIPLDGFAIDNFAINIPKDSFDIGVIEFIDPSSVGPIPGSQQSVSIQIKNFGLDTVYSSLVKYIDHLGFATTETWNGILAPDSTVDYTFSTTYFTPNNIHKLTALTYNYNDHYMFNDTLKQDIQIGLANNDIGITNIIKPYLINNINEVLDVEVEVTNLGLNPVSNFDICYIADNIPLFCETYNGTLQAGQSINYTFTQTFTPPTNNFNLCAKTDLINDEVSLNDEYCNTFPVGINESYLVNFTIGNCKPNPVLNNAIIPVNINHYGIVKFDIYNNLSQRVYSNKYNFNTGENQIEFNTENLASGIYYYVVNYNNTTKYGRFNKN